MLQLSKLVALSVHFEHLLAEHLRLEHQLLALNRHIRLFQPVESVQDFDLDLSKDKVESNLFSTLSATNKGSIYDPSKISTYSTTKTTSILKDSLVDTFLDIEDGKTPSKYIDNKPR